MVPSKDTRRLNGAFPFFLLKEILLTCFQLTAVRRWCRLRWAPSFLSVRGVTTPCQVRLSNTSFWQLLKWLKSKSEIIFFFCPCSLAKVILGYLGLFWDENLSRKEYRLKYHLPPWPLPQIARAFADMPHAVDIWPDSHSIDLNPVQKSTGCAKEISLPCHIWSVCQVMNILEIQACAAEGWSPLRDHEMLNSYEFSGLSSTVTPVFWEQGWCLKCCPVFWRDGQTWEQLLLVECHWDGLCFRRRDSTKVALSLQGVREVLGLGDPGKQ